LDFLWHSCKVNAMKQHELGFFGNIWVRQNELQNVGETFQGHKHKFDHVTLLVSGKVSVEIEGYPKKEFTAPTFIVVRKEHMHKITALTDDVIYYCVFALRDIDGEVMDIFGPQHDPESASGVSDNYWDKVKTLEST
jgi:hypothetical protein